MTPKFMAMFLGGHFQFNIGGTFRSYVRCAVAVAVAAGLQADEPVRPGPGMTNPRMLRKVDPEYTEEARRAGVQGTVAFQIVVNEQGRVEEIEVLSPLGFGLDEQAQRAIKNWEFKPATKEGKPVKVRAVVETTFRSSAGWFDAKVEKQRTSFNTATKNLEKGGGFAGRAAKEIQELAVKRYPPAMHVAGVWAVKGEHGPKDAARGLELIQKSAEKRFGPALYEVGIRYVQGTDLPPDREKGMQLIRDGAVLGSLQAQFCLWPLYESGQEVPQELDRARRYYRL